MAVDNQMLQAALAKAITDSVTPEIQQGVFRDAIQEYLFHGADKQGKLKDAFERALADAAVTVARAIVEMPENRNRLQAAMQAHFEETLRTPVMLNKLLTTKIRGY